MDENEEIIVEKSETYDILLPKKIVIGDEMYLEEMEYNPSVKKFCVIVKRISKNLKCKLNFQEIITNYKPDAIFPKGLSLKNYVVKIILAEHELIMKNFLNNSYYPSLVSYNHELGCDTASFEIIINDNCEHINTGTDGYYGYHIAYKEKKGHLIEFSLSDEFYTEKEVRKLLSYLFDCNEINEQ